MNDIPFLSNSNPSLSTADQAAFYYEHSLKKASQTIKDAELCLRISSAARVSIDVLAQAWSSSRDFAEIRVFRGVTSFISNFIIATHVLCRLKEWSFDKNEWSKDLKALSLHVVTTAATVFDVLGFAYVLKNIGVIKGAVALGGAALIGTVGSGLWLPVVLVNLKKTIEELHTNIQEKKKLENSLKELENRILDLEECLIVFHLDEEGNLISSQTKEDVQVQIEGLKDRLKLNKSARMKHVAELVAEAVTVVLCTLALVSFIGGVSAISGGAPILALTVIVVFSNLMKTSLSIRENSIQKRIDLQGKAALQ